MTLLLLAYSITTIVNDAYRVIHQKYRHHFRVVNGTARFENVKHCLNTNIYSYLETSGGQSSNLYLNVVYFFNTSVN
jgi:hypothetical protein